PGPAALDPDIQGADRRVDQPVPQPTATATFSASLRPATHHGASRRPRGRLRQLRTVLPCLPRADGTESFRAANRRRQRWPQTDPRPRRAASQPNPRGLLTSTDSLERHMMSQYTTPSPTI